jgi:ABC-type multidrug transport system ATPase subunit
LVADDPTDLVTGEGETFLIARSPGQAPREIPLVKEVMTLGRSAGNDIVLTETYVSGYHGRFEHHAEGWVYIDQGSTNGTYVNGEKVSKSRIVTGDVLRIGDPEGNSVGLTLRRPDGEAVAEPSGTMALNLEDLREQVEINIGRDPGSNLHLSGAMVSWHHARIIQSGGEHILVDLNSTNGTFVNGSRVTERYTLQEGDVIQIGANKLVFQAQGVRQYEMRAGVRLDGVGIVREVGRGDRTKRILNEISLSVYPREFIALVGTSGAGKSTLMKALSGVSKAQDGQVLVNGDNLYERFDIYRTMIGYVPQDDILHRDLKVGDALRYSARLRLPADTSAEEIEERIDKVLEEVEMIAQKEQPITSLSGGQRKRVSIASELLAEPRLFFLDEPTSGLDPGLEKKMMYTLRRLADAGRTVVLVTHATANINQCDHVCFLSQGRLTYYGPPQESFDFFGVTSGDFADVYNRLDDINPEVARQQAQDWQDRYRASPQYRRYVEDRQTSLPEPVDATTHKEVREGPKVNPFRQLAVLTRRYLDLVLRDKLLLAVLVAIMPIIAALMIIVADRNWLVGDSLAEVNRQLAADLAAGEQTASYALFAEHQTLLFSMSFAAVLLGVFAAGYEIIKEWSVYQRERMVTLRILPYIGSKIIVMGAFAFLQCLLFMLVIALRVEYPKDGVIFAAPLEMYITLVLSVMAALAMGLLVSSLVPNANTVIYLIFLILMFQLIFAGALFDNSSPLTLTRWSMGALGASSNIEGVNSLTRTRFMPDPITESFSTEVEKPSEDWEPITVVTGTQEVAVPIQPGITQTVAISVPEVIENEMITVTEVITESVTVEPDPTDVLTPHDFAIDYSRTQEHMVTSWLVLIGFGLCFTVLTAFVLRAKDVV